MNHRFALAVSCALALALPNVSAFAQTSPTAPAAPATPVDGKTAFAALKSLAGTWSGPIGEANGPKGRVRYEVISGGSVVMEVLFPGEPHEMRSMYHLDKGDLVMTHYCSGGTQPRMRLSKASTATRLVFDFDGGTNFDPATGSYIHDGEISWLPDGGLAASWTFFAKGKAGGAHKFVSLSREK